MIRLITKKKLDSYKNLEKKVKELQNYIDKVNQFKLLYQEKYDKLAKPSKEFVEVLKQQ